MFIVNCLYGNSINGNKRNTNIYLESYNQYLFTKYRLYFKFPEVRIPCHWNFIIIYRLIGMFKIITDANRYVHKDVLRFPCKQ